MQRVLRSRPGRPQMPPQQYSVTSSWNGRVKSVAFLMELSTYSAPSTSLRMLQAEVVEVLAGGLVGHGASFRVGMCG